MCWLGHTCLPLFQKRNKEKKERLKERDGIIKKGKKKGRVGVRKGGRKKQPWCLLQQLFVYQLHCFGFHLPVDFIGAIYFHMSLNSLRRKQYVSLEDLEPSLPLDFDRNHMLDSICLHLIKSPSAWRQSWETLKWWANVLESRIYFHNTKWTGLAMIQFITMIWTAKLDKDCGIEVCLDYKGWVL